MGQGAEVSTEAEAITGLLRYIEAWVRGQRSVLRQRQSLVY